MPKAQAKPKTQTFDIDPLHNQVSEQELVTDIWATKYRWNNERNIDQTLSRVANAIMNGAATLEVQRSTERAMLQRLWMPGGRIIAGAGTGNRVTLMNCYVNRHIQDSLDDIMQANTDAALTQQQGGGIGTHFGTIRPRGARLHRTGAIASGPLPFMDMWDSMCATIKSAGGRRGAMMATITDTHPDLLEFIKAKHQKGRLTNFNVSILVSDAFMAAVQDDEEWALYFSVEPSFERSPDLQAMDFDENDEHQFVYATMPAREIWDQVTRNTYEYSEPGVIFIDRINDNNNLKYLEYIECTNPCGEQPLPPNGACNLGAINLARVVRDPFQPSAEIDWQLIKDTTEVGVRFLDNVIDRTEYPLAAQESEEYAKRRIGLGISGLADCLAQLGLRYGTPQAAQVAEQIMQTICLEAYQTSAKLAQESQPFPLFDKDRFFNGGFADKMLPRDLKDRIRDTGIRNGVLLTVAPTGTTSILYGNVSSGIEPVFRHKYTRYVNQNDGTRRQYDAYDYNYLLYCAYLGKKVEPGDYVQPGDFDMPVQCVTADDLTVEQHVMMQAAIQRWTDASVSKTINVAKETTFADFQKVYDLAYTLGCKGCTTYRPSDVRGSVLSLTAAGDEPSLKSTHTHKLVPRDEVLTGVTRKVKWPSMSSALYITINKSHNSAYEVFFNSKDARYQEWMTGLSLMISAILRLEPNDISFISRELEAVHSVHDTAWIQPPDGDKPRFFGSLLAYIGYIIGHDFNTHPTPIPTSDELPTSPPQSQKVEPHQVCPMCLARAIVFSEGCRKCLNCSYSSC